ncbi:MAG TPA: fused MFS/spermidine synthase [Polyangiales bacterium]|nr:fused MFS/spermidine synthase [Polyangiales bacterium]
MHPYAVTIFLSSFLLFLVQPLIARQILPWFGGAASVWTTCLLFFQSVLLAGYAYAHAVVRWLKPRQQVYAHSALLLASLAVLPILANPSWKPIGHEDPIPRILGLLALTIGPPYVLLSTTTPLLQAWYWRSFRTRVPYRLFALSNLASLIALFGYPLYVEPRFGVTDSAKLWSGLYAAFVAVCVWSGVYSLREAASPERIERSAAEPPEAASGEPARHVALWLLYSTLGTCTLLAVSNHITQNIASVPLIWVLPLALYLLTFIICFDRPAWYVRGLVWPLLALLLLAMSYRINSVKLQLVLPLFSAGLFAACMFCHGELARLRPAPSQLTLYYLMIAAGGALGALLIAIGAPLVLSGYYEMHAVLVLLAVLLAACAWRTDALYGVIALSVVAFVIWFDADAIRIYTAGVREMRRDFYGVVRIRDWSTTPKLRVMFHGGINHGGQYLDPKRALEPTCYVGSTSGYGRVLRTLHSPKKVGVLGLGVGALMTYAQPGDSWVFYEIDPLVVGLAERHFSFLRAPQARVEHVLGDGRLSLEREAPRGFDLLAIDAFSGDAVPMHLVTREAMAIYVKHIKPDGAIVFQATNRFVDLKPVIRRLADELGMHTLWVDDEPKLRPGDFAFGTDQIIVTKNAALLEAPLLQAAGKPAPARHDLAAFTDDYYNLWRILN